MAPPTRPRDLSASTKRAVLHECGFRCGNPICRGIITLDIHHIEPVAEDGSNTADNLIALCPNCHSLHHGGKIPRESIRAWKMVLLSLNEGFSRAAMDTLLALHHLGGRPLLVAIEAVLGMGSLISSGLIRVEHPSQGTIPERDFHQTRFVSLSSKGKTFVAAWVAGNQRAAVEAID
jgi:hypothetical protein